MRGEEAEDNDNDNGIITLMMLMMVTIPMSVRRHKMTHMYQLK